MSVIVPSGAGCPKLNFQAVIKSAASAASPTAWELHGSARTPSSAGGDGLRVPVVEAALAARLITA